MKKLAIPLVAAIGLSCGDSLAPVSDTQHYGTSGYVSSSTYTTYSPTPFGTANLQRNDGSSKVGYVVQPHDDECKSGDKRACTVEYSLLDEICANGSRETVSCGFLGRGEKEIMCENGQWNNDYTECSIPNFIFIPRGSCPSVHDKRIAFTTQGGITILDIGTHPFSEIFLPIDEVITNVFLHGDNLVYSRRHPNNEAQVYNLRTQSTTVIESSPTLTSLSTFGINERYALYWVGVNDELFLKVYDVQTEERRTIAPIVGALPSINGNQVAYLARRGTNNSDRQFSLPSLFVYDLIENTNTEIPLPSTFSPQSPSLYEDGLAFWAYDCRERDNRGECIEHHYFLNNYNLETQTLTSIEDLWDAHPSIVAGANRTIFFSGGRNHKGFYAYPLTEGVERRIWSNGHYLCKPSVSGNLIAFISQLENSEELGIIVYDLVAH